MAAVDPIFLTICIAAGAILILIVVFGCVCAKKKKQKSPIEFAAPLQHVSSKQIDQYEIADGQLDCCGENYGENYGDEDYNWPDEFDEPIYENEQYPDKQPSTNFRYANQSRSAQGPGSESTLEDEYDATGNYVQSSWYKKNYNTSQYYRNNNTANYDDERTSLLPMQCRKTRHISTAIDNVLLQSPNINRVTWHRPSDDILQRRLLPRIKPWERRGCKSVGERLIEASPEYKNNRSRFARHGLPGRWVAYTPSPGKVAYRRASNIQGPARIPAYVHSTRRQTVKEMVESIKDRSFNDSNYDDAHSMFEGVSFRPNMNQSRVRFDQHHLNAQQGHMRDNNYAGYLSSSNEPRVRLFSDITAKPVYMENVRPSSESPWQPFSQQNPHPQSPAPISSPQEFHPPAPTRMTALTEPPPPPPPPPPQPPVQQYITPPPQAQYVPASHTITPAKPVLVQTQVIPAPPPPLPSPPTTPNKPNAKPVLVQTQVIPARPRLPSPPTKPNKPTAKPVLIHTPPPTPQPSPKPVASPKPIAKPILIPASPQTVQSSPREPISPKPVAKPILLASPIQHSSVDSPSLSSPVSPVRKLAAKPVLHQSPDMPLSPSVSPQKPPARYKSPARGYGSPQHTPKTPPPLPMPTFVTQGSHLTKYGTPYKSPPKTPPPLPLPQSPETTPSPTKPVAKPVLIPTTPPPPSIVYPAKYRTRFQVSPKIQAATGVKHKTIIHISPQYHEVVSEKSPLYTWSTNNNGSMDTDLYQENYFQFPPDILKPDESSKNSNSTQERPELEQQVHNFVADIIKKVSSEDVLSGNDNPDLSNAQTVEPGVMFEPGKTSTPNSSETGIEVTPTDLSQINSNLYRRRQRMASFDKLLADEAPTFTDSIEHESVIDELKERQNRVALKKQAIEQRMKQINDDLERM